MFFLATTKILDADETQIIGIFLRCSSLLEKKQEKKTCNDSFESDIAWVLLGTQTDEHEHKHTHTIATLCTLEHNTVSERLIVCLMDCMNLILLKRVLIAKELDWRGHTHTHTLRHTHTHILVEVGEGYSRLRKRFRTHLFCLRA